MTTGALDGDRLGGKTTSLRDLMEHDCLGGFADGPERELFVAVLYDAIRVLIHASPDGRGDGARRYREAVWWIESSGDDYIFSFESVCGALGIDPGYLREGLRTPLVSRLQKARRGSSGSMSAER